MNNYTLHNISFSRMIGSITQKQCCAYKIDCVEHAILRKCNQLFNVNLIKKAFNYSTLFKNFQ